MARFALIEARTRCDAAIPVSSRSSRDRGPTPAVKIQIPLRDFESAGLSIVIGSNGTGKTRLLSAVAEAFMQLDQARQENRSWPLKRFALNELTYAMGQDIYKLSSYGRANLRIFKNDKPCDLSELILPSRVVALTVAPHDRFPLGRTLTSGRVSGENIYRYMGLRDRSGRASMLGFLYSALENLLEDGEHIEGRRDRIASVFNLLKYKPKFEITYSLRMSRSVISEALKSHEFIKDLPSYQQRRLRDMIGLSSGGYEDFKASLMFVMEKMAGDRVVTVSADITDHDHGDILQFQMLRKVGVLSIRAIEIERHDGIFVDLKEASSGELSIAASFLALAGVLENDSLIMIDEPEISLHPEWQSTYIDTLTSTFRGYTGCHYLIATHSPLILSDVPQEATIYSLDKNIDIDGETVSGGSADRLLAQLFKTPVISNLYIKEEIVHALRLAADGNAGTAEFKSAVSNLVSIGTDINDGEPVKAVIDALSATLQGSQ